MHMPKLFISRMQSRSTDFFRSAFIRAWPAIRCGKQNWKTQTDTPGSTAFQKRRNTSCCIQLTPCCRADRRANHPASACGGTLCLDRVRETHAREPPRQDRRLGQTPVPVRRRVAADLPDARRATQKLPKDGGCWSTSSMSSTAADTRSGIASGWSSCARPRLADRQQRVADHHARHADHGPDGIGFWCEVAWIKMARRRGPRQTRAADPHRAGTEGRKEEAERRGRQGGRGGRQGADKVLYTSDCLCLSQGVFRPHSKFKPDRSGRPTRTSKPPRRSSNSRRRPGPQKSGSKRPCRPVAGLPHDEQEVVDRTEPVQSLPDAAQAFWMSMRVPGDKYVVKRNSPSAPLRLPHAHPVPPTWRPLVLRAPAVLQHAHQRVCQRPVCGGPRPCARCLNAT